MAVRLVGRQGAVYFAELDLRGKDGRAVYSCRPSDALTVALLQPVPVPILIDRRLFETDGDVDRSARAVVRLSRSWPGWPGPSAAAEHRCVTRR